MRVAAPSRKGVAWLEVNVVDGRRQSAADAYLRDVLYRPNLTVFTGARVLRLTVEDGRSAVPRRLRRDAADTDAHPRPQAPRRAAR